MRYGYARVSATSQSLDVQFDDLNKHACEHIRSEKVSGRSLENRPELRLLLDFMRPGDELFVTRLDRLARSITDLRNIIDILNKKDCVLRATQQAIDTSTSVGRLMVGFLALFSEFELEIRKERQMEGIAMAKERGVYARPRSPTFDPAEICKLFDKGTRPADIAKKLGSSKQTIYRVLHEQERLPRRENVEPQPNVEGVEAVP